MQSSGPPSETALAGEVDAPQPDGRSETRTVSLKLRENPVLVALLEAVDSGLLILDSRRRIVAADTRRLPRPVPIDPSEDIVGLRVGDVLRCHHGANAPEGCGTGDACRDCGALAAITACQKSGRPEERECLFRVGDRNDLAPLELRVRASTATIDGEECLIVALRDVSSEKRRELLEQVFFHDLLNTVAALSGWAWTLAHGKADDLVISAERAGRLVEHLGREVAYQRALLEAERGTLRPHWQLVEITSILDELASLAAYYGEGRSCSLVVENRTARLSLVTDPVLLQRLLINMVKNAFEASPIGGAVSVTWESEAREEASTTTEDGAVRGVSILVHNQGAIPERARLHVFQRSFTTKPGKGRGIGTYSMRLIGERYLGGNIGFVTSAEHGTVFRLTLPLAPGPSLCTSPPAPSRQAPHP